MPHFYKINKNQTLLTILFFLFLFSSTNSLILNETKDSITKSYSPLEKIFNIKENPNNILRQLSYTCATTSYSKSDIKEECDDGPSSYERLLIINLFQIIFQVIVIIVMV